MDAMTAHRAPHGRQLMQQNVQKSSRTTLPRNPAMVSGRSVLNQPAPHSSGARTRAVVADSAMPGS